MLACEHPEIFKAAILVGGSSGPQLNLVHRIADYRAHHAAGTLGDHHLDHLRYGVTQDWANSSIGRYLLAGFAERGLALDSESIARVFEALTVFDLTPRLPIYKSQTLIVNGEHDTALPAGTRTAEHRILPRTGHCCLLEDPEGFEKLFPLRNDLWPRVSEMWAGGCSSRLPKRSALD